MARIDASSDGVIVRCLVSDLDESQYPEAHPAAATQLRFDDGTNRALVADLGRSTDPYRLTDGTLYRNWQAVPINPDGEGKRDREAIAAAWGELQQYLDLSSPTGAQTVKAVRLLIRGLRMLARSTGTLERQ